MMKSMLKCKIHRATVTDAVLHYEGSVTIDRTLMDAAGLVEYEQVHIWNVDNGNRFTTYAIEGEADSGVICLNGAAARQVSKGDLVIIAAFSSYDEKELANFQPTLVYVDRKNRITDVKRKVESESQRPRVAAAV
ncbi:MAG TPA: aspartate 1-decarboxylase [Thermoanaerobaculia bacterium]|nr:aspartate 1-decarboxylase [Thermoanaerobaculia bacterium]